MSLYEKCAVCTSHHKWSPIHLVTIILHFPDILQVNTTLWSLNGADDHRKLIYCSKLPLIPEAKGTLCKWTKCMWTLHLVNQLYNVVLSWQRKVMFVYWNFIVDSELWNSIVQASSCVCQLRITFYVTLSKNGSLGFKLMMSEF